METLSILLQFWKRLSSVKRFTFQALSDSWDRRGEGAVFVIKTEDTLVFKEEGIFQDGVRFTNALLWRLHKASPSLSLEHIRYKNPVFLVSLVPVNSLSLAPCKPHLCKADSYFAKVALYPSGIKLSWQVRGPKKRERIESFYI